MVAVRPLRMASAWRCASSPRWPCRVALRAVGGLAYGLLIRPWQLRWGSTAKEARGPLAGDDLVPDATYTPPRGVTIQAPAGEVWPGLVQLGQGRGGFYTYDWLERLAGAAIRSADRLVPEFQTLEVGDTIRLSPVGGPTLVQLEPARVLVLRDTMDVLTGRSVPPGGAPWEMDWSWSFTFRPASDGATRLLVRTRAAVRPHALLAPAAALLVDNLRIALIALVVAHHAGQPYGPTGGVWLFSEARQAPILGAFFTVNASLGMGLFFLLAAYFLPASYDRKGTLAFLRDRVLRLGLPFFLGSLLIFVPAYYMTEGRASSGPRAFWRDFVLVYFGPWHLGHLWFLADLLAYTAAYALWRRFTPPAWRGRPRACRVHEPSCSLFWR
jgi:hypothetical protein